MGNVPVLKSHEIVLLLEILGFVEVRHAALTSNFDILMDVAQLFRFMQGVIFRPFYCDK